MKTAIDTNVFVALWDKEHALNSAARTALDRAFQRGTLVISAVVFAELIAAPGRSEAFLDSFFDETGIFVDWSLEEAIWRAAGRGFQGYAARRRTQGESGPRRILADFLVGAHAVRRGCSLLTLDDRLYHAAFPQLSVIEI